MSNIDINFIEFNEESLEMNYSWKDLDEVCRKWAIMSQFEKDLSDYAERAARVE